VRAKTIKQVAVLNVERTPAELRRALEVIEARYATMSATVRIAQVAL
jgi:hypothetical protein